MQNLLICSISRKTNDRDLWESQVRFSMVISKSQGSPWQLWWCWICLVFGLFNCIWSQMCLLRNVTWTCIKNWFPELSANCLWWEMACFYAKKCDLVVAKGIPKWQVQELVVTESCFFIYSFTAAEIAPFVEILLTNLFKALTLPGSSENEYIMKGRPFPWCTDYKCLISDYKGKHTELYFRFHSLWQE